MIARARQRQLDPVRSRALAPVAVEIVMERPRALGDEAEEQLARPGGRPRDARVERVVEKPMQFISPYAVIGIYMFGPHVFEAVNSIKPSPRGELEITDTLQYLVDTGRDVRAHLLKEPSSAQPG